jgi:hypothetical protein
MFADVRIDGRQGVVEQDDVAALVDGPGETNALLLTTAKIDPLKTSLSECAPVARVSIRNIAQNCYLFKHCSLAC